MGVCYANDINDIREDVLRLYLNSHLHMLQTTAEFDLKVNLPPKINLPLLLVAIFSSAKQEVFENKKEVEGHKTKTNTNFRWKYL